MKQYCTHDNINEGGLNEMGKSQALTFGMFSFKRGLFLQWVSPKDRRFGEGQSLLLSVVKERKVSIRSS